eukprot:gene7553-703_t
MAQVGGTSSDVTMQVQELIARADGKVDVRLAVVLQYLNVRLPSLRMSLGAAVCERSKQLLANFPTSAMEDQQLLSSYPDPHMQLCIQYRLAKKVCLQQLIQITK